MEKKKRVLGVKCRGNLSDFFHLSILLDADVGLQVMGVAHGSPLYGPALAYLQVTCSLQQVD